MRRSLVSAATQIEPNNSIVINDPKRVHALWRNVDAPITCGCCYEEERLALDERAKIFIELGPDSHGSERNFTRRFQRRIIDHSH